LANRRRLRILQSLVGTPGKTVTEIAEENGVSVSSATQCLRALNARGLLAATRRGRWVEYRVGHDPLVRGTAELVRALTLKLGEGNSEAVERIFKELTAFTHPRRVAMVRVLSRKPDLRAGELRRAVGCSESALYRHLEKLVSRGVIHEEGGRYRCSRNFGPVVKVLVRLARMPRPPPHSHTL